MWHSKGDVKTKEYLISNKMTDKKSYSLKLKDWNQIVNDAFDEDRIPLMMIDINGTTLCVMDENTFEVIIDK